MATRDGKPGAGIIITPEVLARFKARDEAELRSIEFMERLSKLNPGLFRYDDYDGSSMLGVEEEKGESDG